MGTGSIRGMPMLARLHHAGFHLWPFQAAELPLALEIYPRLFTGAVVKSSRDARMAYLQQPRYARCPTMCWPKQSPLKMPSMRFARCWEWSSTPRI